MSSCLVVTHVRSRTMPQTIGFVGIGIMGQRMCRNVLKAGFPVVAYDVDPAARQLCRWPGRRCCSGPPRPGSAGGCCDPEPAGPGAGPGGRRRPTGSPGPHEARHASLRCEHRGSRDLPSPVRCGKGRGCPCPGCARERRTDRRRGRHTHDHGGRRRGGLGGGAAGSASDRQEDRPLRRRRAPDRGQSSSTRRWWRCIRWRRSRRCWSVENLAWTLTR